jgi:hypothetical protein
VGRRLLACALPTIAIVVAWIRIEDPRLVGEALTIAGLALLPVVAPTRLSRALVVAAVTATAAWIAFGVAIWELAPFRDERVVAPFAEAAGRGFVDFYRTVLPFEPARNAEMHGLLLAAIFGFVLAIGVLVAARHPIAAAAVTVAGACWPVTLLGEEVELGALALAAALSIPLLTRVRSGPALAAGVAAAALVVAGSAWASSATTIAREAALDWETWDFGGPPPRATGVRFVWDSSYGGIDFPKTKTVVLRVRGPERARYWRASTLESFVGDHWLEDRDWVGRADVDERRPLLDDRFLPRRARRQENWLEQRVELRALVDDRLVAAGTPLALEAGDLGAVFRLSSGALLARDQFRVGKRYRVWSYDPDPAPSVLAASKPRYPADSDRYLRAEGRTFPVFGASGRELTARALLDDPADPTFAVYKSLYDVARRVTADARTPYSKVLALESWFRYRGGFRYDESPPQAEGPPLVSFVNRVKAGYCQHFAGAMALMLRMLGIPARVAVGFTSGRLDEGAWVVTDHEAHAWVEVWFAGQGWVPFDPTPGRGTFSGEYSFASDSPEAVDALRRGDLQAGPDRPDRTPPDRADRRTGLVAAEERPSLFALVLGAGLVWALVVGGGKTLRRRLRYLTKDPRRAATASRLELEAFLRDQGIAVPANATLEVLRRTVGEELGYDCERFASAAARARFGPPAETLVGARAARRELRVLLRRIRADLSVWERLRGFVSLRSLRGGWQS